ncbi:MAG: hypothetical protein BWY24_00064 [Microgenomates group bacterium ADurb.Bin219]|nr:MAG: hypothetical protein BWY24_00064 [Microgenomates group bacterium ADurb.Bin219]HNP89089.1 transcription termination factor NusA [Candidatus Woesebacteria bacterium]
MRSLKSARSEFSLALTQVATERGIAPEMVLESIKAAIVAAYKKDAKETGELKEDWDYGVEIDPGTGESTVFGWPLEKEDKKVVVTPPGFGRIAAVTAKQVIKQKLREAEKGVIIDEYSRRIGSLVTGMILRFDGANIVVDIGRAEAVMPPQEQVKQEGLRINEKMSFYLEGIRESAKGKDIVVSRANPGLVEGLFKREVPEVASGAVEIKAIAREPGSRSKVAVVSTQAGVDPVGSCVGQKGVRVQAVIEELNGEKIDIIPYSEEMDKYIASALAPAENLEVKIEEDKKRAVVFAPQDQLSLAIGKEGQNARLAAKLTEYKIDIKGEEEKEEEPIEEKKPKTKRAKKAKKE